MFDAELVRHIYNRTLRALTAKPSFARGAGRSTARLVDGFACTVTSGPHQIALDLPDAEGGANGGPSPGQVMRCGLVACLAVGYRLWGIRLDVPLDEVTVEMTCELDARGQLGIDGVPPGWQRVSWTVRVVSDAPEEDVRRVLDHADRVSPMLATLDRDIVRERAVEISRRPS
ncbi:MAG TPA: OsmC family protein [Haliangiales bacterium]|nr:OsmC family protein [Haliangiales bacterium]